MRRKKDPEIRREVFIRAAQALFLSRGYESVSVGDVLDAVGERSASPSVFYYYFKSKDDLYQACLQAAAAHYLAAMQDAFLEEAPLEQALPSLAQAMEESLAAYGSLLSAAGKEAPVPDRLVILDLRDQVTQRIGELWVPFLVRTGLTEKKAVPLSRFLAGGIGELAYVFLLAGDSGEKARHQVIHEIAEFTMRTLRLPEEEQQSLMAVLQGREERADGDT